MVLDVERSLEPDIDAANKKQVFSFIINMVKFNVDRVIQ